MKTVRPSPFLTLLYCVCIVLHPCAVASSRRPTGGDVTAGPGKTTDRQAGSVPPLPGRVPRPWVRARLWPLRRLLRELGAGRRRVEEWVCSWEVTMSSAASWFPIYTDTQPKGDQRVANVTQCGTPSPDRHLGVLMQKHGNSGKTSRFQQFQQFPLVDPTRMYLKKQQQQQKNEWTAFAKQNQSSCLNLIFKFWDDLKIIYFKNWHH